MAGWAEDTNAIPNRLEGVLVQAFLSPTVVYETHTDSNGFYHFDTLEFGFYDAVASLQGYFPDTVAAVPCTSALCRMVDFQLLPAECGDCNGDSRVTIADATYIVSYVYRGGPGPIGSGDVNSDTRVTIADATYLVSFIYRSGPAPCEP
jgi:hypothetical protein